MIKLTLLLSLFECERRTANLDTGTGAGQKMKPEGGEDTVV